MITTTTVRNTITEQITFDQLTKAFAIDLDGDLADFDQLTAALRELVANGSIVEGSIAAAQVVYAPAGTIVPQEW